MAVAGTTRRMLPFWGSTMGAVLIWSTSFVATKVALVEIPPLTIGLLRFALAAGILGLAGALQRTLSKPTRIDLVLLGIGGLLGFTLYSALENVGLDLATASDAALIVASFPVITLAFEMVIDRTGVSPLHVVGIVVTMIGVALIVHESAVLPSPNRLWGDIMLVFTGFLWAGYNFATRHVQRRYSTLTVIFYQTLLGAIGFVPLAIVEHDRWRIPGSDALLMIAYLGVFCSVLAFVFYAHGLKGMRASMAVTLLNLIPVFGLVFAMLLLNESENVVQLIGGAVVIAGVVLSLRNAPQEMPGQVNQQIGQVISESSEMTLDLPTTD